MLVSLKLTLDDGELLLEEGQTVDFSTPYLKKKSQQDVTIPLAAKMKIAPTDIFMSLKKVIGDKVKKGELIAQKKGVFGTKHYYSEFDGVIKKIDHNQGLLIMSAQLDRELTLPAFFKGSITSVKKDEIEIKLPKGVKFSLKSASSDFGGEIHVLKEKDSFIVDEHAICDHVVIASSLAVYEQAKLEALDANGFVTAKKLSDETDSPYAILQDETDLSKILKLSLPYCIIDREQAIIYFYQ